MEEEQNSIVHDCDEQENISKIKKIVLGFEASYISILLIQ